MVSNILKLSVLFAGFEGFVENLRLQLSDCCAYRQEGIVILMDRADSEREGLKNGYCAVGGAIGLVLYRGLIGNKNTPILVSKSVLANILEWLNKQSSLVLPILPAHWTVFELADFYFLVPTIWLEKKKYLQDVDIGINIHKLSRVSWNKILPYAPSKDNVIPFEDVLSRLFVTKQQLKQTGATPTKWMIFLSGHGSKETTIADMSIEEFKNFTHFLKNDINTKIFIYLSCFAGGINKIKGYEREKIVSTQKEALAQETFPFPIILLSSMEAPAVITGAVYKFDDLFDGLAKSKEILPDYYRLMAYADFFKDMEVGTWVQNLPQIRLPGTEWFSVAALNTLDKNDNYIVLSKIQSRAREKYLNIKNTVHALFVYIQKIPFALSFFHKSTDFIPRMVFLADGDQYHFAEIIAQNLNFQNLCTLFMPFDKNATKTIYIDKLTFCEEQAGGGCKSTVLYNAQFIERPKSDSLYNFSLLGTSGDGVSVMYSGDFALNKVGLYKIELVNYQKEVLKHPLTTNIPEILTFKPFRQQLEPLLQKKRQAIIDR